MMSLINDDLNHNVNDDSSNSEGHKVFQLDIENDQVTTVFGLNAGATLKLTEMLRFSPTSGDDFIVVRKGEDCRTSGDDFIIVREGEDCRGG
jgi:hypothetical protein